MEQLPTFDDVERAFPGSAADGTKTYTDYIGIFIDCTVISVDDVRQTFDTFLNIHVHYKLPSNVARSPEARALVGPDRFASEGFSILREEFPFFIPTITLNNCIESKFDDFLKTVRVSKRTGEIWVQYENYCTIFEDLELRKFPYDRQVFRIYLNTLGVGVLPWHINVEAADFPSTRTPHPHDDTDLVVFQAKNWNFKGKKVDLTGMELRMLQGTVKNWQKTLDKQMLKDHDVRITFVADRDGYYYQSNYILISAFLVFGTSSVFLIPVNNVEERQGLAITILLAMVALKFALSANTPVIGYNTYLDFFLLTWYVLLFLAIFWSFIAGSYVLFACDNQLADEDCIADESQKVRDVESIVSFGFIGLWALIIFLMIGIGNCKDDYSKIMAKQTEEVDVRKKFSVVSMQTDKEEDKTQVDAAEENGLEEQGFDEPGYDVPGFDEEVFKVENEVLTGEEEVYKPEPQEERPKLNVDI